MSRKLICLVSAHGKTTEEVAEKIVSAVKKFEKNSKTFKPLIVLNHKHTMNVLHPLGTGIGCSCGKVFMSDANAEKHLKKTASFYKNWQADVKKRLKTR